MTEQKYLKMPWSVEDTIENLKEIKEIMIVKVRAVNLDGKAERDAKEVALDFDRAISALEEIQAYRATELDAYRALGTVEELREAMEKQRKNKMKNRCPDCGTPIKRCYFYCPGCGQAIDYSEEENCNGKLHRGLE